MDIVPVLLSGGTGTRLWPLSRESHPKQLLALCGEETMLQQTARRVADPARFAPLMVIANAEHRFSIGEQLQAIGARVGHIVLEPVGRNTAPAAAIAALVALAEHDDPALLLMSADHLIRDIAGFRSAVDEAFRAAEAGSVALFGIAPTSAATGYGYIQMGEVSDPAGEARQVLAFREKPSQEVAETYLASGKHVWNSGIFLMPARKLVAELERHEPELLAACREALDAAATDLDFLRLDPDAFARAKSISIDYAVMERLDDAVVVPAAFDWTDVGTWSALWEVSEQDEAGNSRLGDVVTHDVSGCYLRSEGRLIAAAGIRDLIIVATNDAVLVTSRQSDQDVKALVEEMKSSGHVTATQTEQVHRPWGYYRSIHQGDRFQVKRITVKPGAKLSLQKHFHRAEHWIVVNGTALVTRDDETILLRENESVFLPLGCVHRLENPGKLPLNLIEVQSGAYLGEDDIVRIEDVYARA